MKKEIAINFTQKWTAETSEFGFTQIPNLLIICQGHLGLTDGELVTLIELLKFWYDYDSRIFPSIETLAKYSGRGYSTVQRRLKNLEKKGFIKRKHRFATSDDYDMYPCVAKLYKHQEICASLSQYRGDDWQGLGSLPSSVSTDKQYEAIKDFLSKNTKNPLGPWAPGPWALGPQNGPKTKKSYNKLPIHRPRRLIC